MMRKTNERADAVGSSQARFLLFFVFGWVLLAKKKKKLIIERGWFDCLYFLLMSSFVGWFCWPIFSFASPSFHPFFSAYLNLDFSSFFFAVHVSDETQSGAFPFFLYPYLVPSRKKKPLKLSKIQSSPFQTRKTTTTTTNKRKNPIKPSKTR